MKLQSTLVFPIMNLLIQLTLEIQMDAEIAISLKILISTPFSDICNANTTVYDILFGITGIRVFDLAYSKFPDYWFYGGIHFVSSDTVFETVHCSKSRRNLS